MIKIGYTTKTKEDFVISECSTAPEANQCVAELKDSCSDRTDIAYFWLSSFDPDTGDFQPYGFIDP